MYVIADLEWVEANHRLCSFTQIALVRVNEDWEPVDRFFSRIRPLNASFHQWDHVGFSGATPSEFLEAPGVFSVMSEVENWLQEDDVMLWWNDAGFPRLYGFSPNTRRKTLILDQYVPTFLATPANKHPSPYTLGEKWDIPAPGQQHHAQNDVEMIRLLLQGTGFPAEMLTQPPPSSASPEMQNALVRRGNLPYLADTTQMLIHKSDCEKISTRSLLKGYATLKRPIGRGYRPCSCLETEFRQAVRVRNADIIRRSEYSFVYSPDSNVYHCRNCKAILGAKKIRGSINYIFEGTKMRPCKICNPTPEDATHRYIYPSHRTQQHRNKGLTSAEFRALNRQRQAREERAAYARNGALTQSNRDDLYTLTQPRFAFWASAGYKCFHLRNCRKMVGLSNLQGFSRFDEAISHGFQPCKYCKPNRKHDIILSMPIYSKERQDENQELLITRCNQNGYSYTATESDFTLETPVGIWKIDTERKPYRLEHINLVSTPENRTCFHPQPRIFHSLHDTFLYIKRHDDTLMAKTLKGAQ